MVGQSLPVRAAPVIRKATIFANIALFQLGWFACVISAAQGHPWMGTALAAAIVAWHIWRAAQPQEELNLVLQVMLIGAIWDSMLVTLGWISYSSGTILPGAAPHWIIALWALFATSLNLSMRWLKERLGLAAVMGAVCGPLSYWAAVRLGAVDFVRAEYAVVALSFGWSLIMPLLMLLSRHFDGFIRTQQQPS